MRRLGISLVVALILAVSAITYLALRPDPWRPTDENWPPAQTYDDPEEADMPVEMKRPPQTGVVWGDYQPGFKKRIDAAGDAGDCAAIVKFFDEAAATPTPDRLALTYIDRWGEHLACRQFAEEK